MNALKVFSGSSSRALSDRICQSLGVEPGAVEFVRFSNDNIKVKISENVRGCDVFFIQTSCPPVSDHLMELLIALDALKYASAGRITAVLPYYPYALSDSKDEPRISVAGRLMADLIAEAGADRILTMSLHSPQIMGFCRIPVDQLSGVPIICSHFDQQLDLSRCVAAAPNISRAKVTEVYAKRLGLPLAVIDNRIGSAGLKAQGVIGEVDDRDVILFDDEVVTGESILVGAEAVVEQGADAVHAGCVHGTLPGDARERLAESPLQSIVVTDTMPQPEDGESKISVCSVAPHFADAIRAIHDETSISTLFR
ncbi:MAG: ribose-phosphate diphosphokinase [Candidatus Latescibacterota bacterium]|nr:ribose-phosphate diphosphokinase [Candidatus Latescibacterota bacterium]